MQVKFSFDVPQYYIVKFSKVIREKLDVIMLQLDVLYCIQSGIREMPNGNLVVENGDIKRMYFFEQNRYYSASFPFLIKKGDSEEEGYSFYCNDIEISSSLLANMQEIISQLRERGLSSIEYFDLIAAIEDVSLDECGKFNKVKADALWNIISYLLTVEDSYVRYDYDEAHVEANHPLNHLDINYSTYGTYKIGLPDSKKEFGIENKHYISPSWFRELCNSNPIKRIENV